MLRRLSLTILLSAGMAAAETSHLSARDGVEVVHAWARATSGGDGAVYMEIANTGLDGVTLTGAETPVATAASIVAGAFKQEQSAETVPAFPIAAGTMVEFAPGGLYIALDGLTGPLVEGGHFEMLLRFDPIGTLEVDVEIEAADARAHSHAGHSH